MIESEYVLIAEQLRELKAEIERLKVENETLRAANALFEGGMHWRNGLITELCDALEPMWIHSLNPYIKDLLMRAREATR